MKVLLINVCLRYESPRYVLPVGIGYIGMALRNAGYEFDVLDLDVLRPSEKELKRVIAEEEYDAYLMGSIVTGYKYIKQLTGIIRGAHPSASIIVGNSVADSIPEILLNKTEADFGVISEGDVTIVELLRSISGEMPIDEVDGICYLKDGKVRITDVRPLIKDLDSLDYIDWSIFDVDFYLRNSANLVNEPCPVKYDDRISMSVPTARGCAFACSFCYQVFRGRGYRFRSAYSIVDEIMQLKDLYNINYLNFWDDLTFPNVKHCEEVVDLLLEKQLGIYWNATVRGDLIRRKDRALVEKMKAAGCIGLTYSLESSDPEILKAMNKKLDLNRFLEQKSVLDDVGVRTWTNLVIGYPQETEATLRASLDFCYEHNMYPSAGYLLPQPGTEMYDYALEHGYIDDQEQYLLTIGDRQDLYVNMSQMGDDTMISITEEGLDRINRKLDLGLDRESLVKTTVKRDSE